MTYLDASMEATILVKSCWEGCVCHFTSYLIHLFQLLGVLFGKCHALVGPPPPVCNPMKNKVSTTMVITKSIVEPKDEQNSDIFLGIYGVLLQRTVPLTITVT